MNPLVRLHARVSGLRPDPALTGRDALAILLRTGANLVRGTLLRARLGSSAGRLFVARGARVMHPGHLHVGRDVKLEEGCELQGLSRQGVRLGDRVTIGRGASIRPSSYYGGELGEGLVIGDGSAVGAFSWIGASGLVEIGRDVLLGPRVVVVPENHVFEDLSRPIKVQGVARAGVVIEDGAWIGTNATVLAGVRVGRGAVVAAGAVVVDDVPPMAVVGGVPARVLRERRDRAA